MTCKSLSQAGLLALFIFFSFKSVANDSADPPTPDTSAFSDGRTHELADLARTWGAVKYLHPYLAYREIEWDEALIEAIPRVDAAANDAQFAIVVNGMLEHLDDRNTFAQVLHHSDRDQAESIPDEDTLLLVRDGVLIVDVTGIAIFAAWDNARFSRRIAEAISLLDSVEAVVLDFRGHPSFSPLAGYYFKAFCQEFLPRLLASNLTLGSTRHRVHNVFASQTGVRTSAYSAFATTTPAEVAGSREDEDISIVVLTDSSTPSGSTLVTGLQGSGKAYVVHSDDGVEKDFDTATMKLELHGDVQVRIRLDEILYPNGQLGFRPDATIKASSSDKFLEAALEAARAGKVSLQANSTTDPLPLVSMRDRDYAQMSFPDREHRLLSLFRIWNTINYFFPYRSLIDEPWDDVLFRYIPEFEAAANALEYQLAVMKLVAEIQDSHVVVRGAALADEKLGLFSPAVLLEHIENQSVVTAVAEGVTGVQPGDIILTVDGIPVEEKRRQLARLTAASTPQALERNVHLKLLGGPKESSATLEVRGADGSIRKVLLLRTRSFRENYGLSARETLVVDRLPGGFGYVDLDRLQGGDVGQAIEAIRGTKAAIFDMRGYPNGAAWELIRQLADSAKLPHAVIGQPFVDAASYSEDADPHGPSMLMYVQHFLTEGLGYDGRKVVLINQWTQSQSEMICLTLEQLEDVVFIGTPTAGANGSVTHLVLPGGLTVQFSGIEIRHGDGRQLQRVGVLPDIRVERSVEGVTQGRDEMLEAAIKHLAET